MKQTLEVRYSKYQTHIFCFKLLDEIITKLSLVAFYHYLYLELPHFEGQCRYGSGESDYMHSSKESSYLTCLEKCKLTNGCSAVAYHRDTTCAFYRGGPYTQGDGLDGIACYPLQGNLLFLFKYFANAHIFSFSSKK